MAIVKIYPTHYIKVPNTRSNKKNYEENIKVILSFIEEIAQKTHHTVKDIISNSSVDIDLLLLVFSKHLVTSEVSGKFAIQVQTFLHNEYHKELN